MSFATSHAQGTAPNHLLMAVMIPVKKRTDDMSNEIERFFERQDEAVSALFLENKGDELTDILVAALEEAFEILLEAAPAETVH
ncbi:hypothetical protein HFO99_29730 [Rhizobium leguminosarum]|nr:hypothetical protein [Rhizobium leguminosarum]MBY5338037.1 hypothetical protein [Rhizobium leguminosarum]